MSLKQFLKSLEVPHESEKQLSILQNPDLEPMPPSRRTWGFWSYAGYWAIFTISIWSWSVGSSLLSLGLNIQHSMGALTIANIFAVSYALCNSGPGSFYHIGFTVCQRIVFGIYGSGLGILIRIILSIVYYGSQAWLGGLCFVVMFSCLSEDYLNMKNTFPDSIAMTTRDFIGFLVFQLISLPFFFMKPEKLNSYVNVSCVLCLIGMITMFIYLLCINGGPGPIYYQKVELSGSKTGWMWIYAMSTWYGALSPDMVNFSDFSRFSTSSKKLTFGVIVGTFLPEIIPLAGLISASICVELYGEEYWLPTDICLQWLRDNYSSGTRAACFFLSFAFMTSELTLNLLSNGFAGGMDIAGIFPRYIDIKRGALITALLSWVVQPWTFYNTASTFLSVMSSFGVIVTPIIAIIASDFILVRKCRLCVNDLYTTSKDGKFYFTYGVNWRGVAVFIIGVVPGLPGIAAYANPNIHLKTDILNFFYGSILFSFFIPLVLYYVVAKWIFPIKNVDDFESRDMFNAYTKKECIALNMVPYDGVYDDVVVQLETIQDSKKLDEVGVTSVGSSYEV